MMKLMGAVFMVIGFLWGSTCLGPVFADELKSLYESEVILKSEENLITEINEINPAMTPDAEKAKEKTITPQQQAFETLLLKLSVSESVLKNPLISTALADPDRYIKQESYHQTGGGERMLRILFDEKMVNDLLNQAQIKLIGKNRPLLLIWLVLEQPGSTIFIDPESDALMIDVLNKAFRARAIPFVMPVFDLEDRRGLQAIDIQNQAFDLIRKASERYHPEAILLCRLKKTAQPESASTEWEGSWTLLKAENNPSWKSRNHALESVFAESAQRLADIYKEAPNLAKAKPEPVEVMRLVSLQLSGISGAEDYSRILEQLQKNSLIEAVHMQQIGSDYIVFEIKTAASRTQLTRLFTEVYQWIADSSIGHSEDQLFYKIESAV